MLANSTLEAAFEELDRTSPGVPMLALGQTVFWDEPMKVGIAEALQRRGSNRQMVFGVHDTDYFAKLPHGARQPGKFATVPHNDTTTKGLWSAAGEFSALFGSETVVTKEMLLQAGSRLAMLEAHRPTIGAELTEAWGWRGIVSLDETAPVMADVKTKALLQELESTLQWATNTSVESLTGVSKEASLEGASQLMEILCTAEEEVSGPMLPDLYEEIIPKILAFVAGKQVPVGTTRTSRLLQFNSETCHQARFDLLGLFLNPATRDEAKRCYDEAVTGAGLYPLSRFGTGAIPFDVYIPGVGRGTLRLGTKGAVINTPRPQFLTFKTPIRSTTDLAAALQAKFGKECAVVGKAVALIGMLSREFIFVFHEGASGYVNRSSKFHSNLREKVGWDVQLHPILRVKYDVWTAMNVCCTWLQLPELLRRPFGSDDVCTPSFATRWQAVAEEQQSILKTLGTLRRPVDLMNYFESSHGGHWKKVADEYRGLQRELEKVTSDVSAAKAKRTELYQKRDELKTRRAQLEKEMGDHFRSKIFEMEPSQQDVLQRERLQHELQCCIQEREDVDFALKTTLKLQRDVSSQEHVARVHERRKNIELEIELHRARLIREAVTASEGLRHASLRPSAWWFPLVSPDGLWYRETMMDAHCYL